MTFEKVEINETHKSFYGSEEREQLDALVGLANELLQYARESKHTKKQYQAVKWAIKQIVTLNKVEKIK